MSSMMWFLTRSSGIVALVLIVAAVADGLVFSGREGGTRLRPKWWMDLHRGLGGYALIFTGVHLLTAFAASQAGIGLAQLLIPGTADGATGAFTLGVLGFYGLAVTVFTSWPKQRLRRRTWHLAHLLSIPATVVSLVHAYRLGTDALTPAYTLLMLALVAVATYPLVLRLSGMYRRRFDHGRPIGPAFAAVDARTPASRTHRPSNPPNVESTTPR